MTVAVVSLALMVVGVAVLVSMPFWAGWWKLQVPKNQGQRRGKRRFRR